MADEVITVEETATTCVNGKAAIKADAKLLEANDARIKLVISNPASGKEAWLAYGKKAAVAGEGILVSPGAVWVDKDWTGDVHAISAEGTTLGIAELSKAVPNATPFTPGPPSTAEDLPGYTEPPTVLPGSGI